MILKSIKKALNPNFLQRIDQNYLLNHPRLWTLKIHYLCYYVGIVNLLLLIGLCFYRFKLYHTTTLIQLGQVFFAINSIGIIGWVILQFYYNIAYNPEKQFGKVDFKKGWLFDIFGYLLCLIILASPAVIFSTVTKIRMITYPIDEFEVTSDLVILKLLNMEKLQLDSLREAGKEKQFLFEKKAHENILDYNYRFVNQLKFDIRSKEIKKNIIANSYWINFNENYFFLNNFLESTTNFSCENNIEDCKLLTFLTSPFLTQILYPICSQYEGKEMMDNIYNSIKKQKILMSLASRQYNNLFSLINKYTGKTIKSKKQVDTWLTMAIEICNNYFEQIYKDKFNFNDIILGYFYSSFIFLSIVFSIIIFWFCLYFRYFSLEMFLIFIPAFLLLILTKPILVFIGKNILNEIVENLINQQILLTSYFMIILLLLLFLFYLSRKQKKYVFNKIILIVNLILIEMIIAVFPIPIILWLQKNSNMNMVYGTTLSCQPPNIYITRELYSGNAAGQFIFEKNYLFYTTYFLILTIAYILTFPYIKHILIKHLSLPKEK